MTRSVFHVFQKRKKKALADSANNQFFFFFHDYIGWPIFVNAGGRDSFFFPRVDDYNVKFVSLSIFFFALVVLSLKATRVELMHSDGPHPASPPIFFCMCLYIYISGTREWWIRHSRGRLPTIYITRFSCCTLWKRWWRAAPILKASCQTQRVEHAVEHESLLLFYITKSSHFI